MILPFQYIFYLLKKYKISLCILCIHPIVNSFSILFPSFVIRYITDSFLISDRVLGFSEAKKWILIYFIIIITLFLYRRIYQYIIKIKLFPLLSKNLVLDCVSSLIDNSKLFFNSHPSAEIAHYLIHLNENLIDGIQLFFERILTHVVSLIFIIVYFFNYNIYCGVAIILWLLFNIIIVNMMIITINDLSKNIVFNKSLISKCIVDLFNNIALVQVFCKQRKELSLLNKNTNLLVDSEKLIVWCYFKIYCNYFISFVIMQAASVYILLNQYQLGIIGASDIVFWWMISGILGVLADNLINDILLFPKYYAGIIEGLAVFQNETQLIKNKKFIFTEGRIEFKNVYFSFENKIILENFSLIIQPKEKIAIVGFSGTGKTTLIFLLLRMYTPQKGSIYIDDQDIFDIKKESLYAIFSVILQENNILDRSILDNIIYSNDNIEIDEKKIYEIISLVALQEFQDDIYSSVNHHQSIMSKILSGGQKQRISIARALYKKEASIFLFDEPTSSLDPITEDAIMQGIEKTTKNKTLIIITHKLSIIQWVPRILVFDKGKIIESGSHQELLDRDGLYKKLWSLNEVI